MSCSDKIIEIERRINCCEIENYNISYFRTLNNILTQSFDTCKEHCYWKMQVIKAIKAPNKKIVKFATLASKSHNRKSRNERHDKNSASI